MNDSAMSESEPISVKVAQPGDAPDVARLYTHYVAQENATFDREGWTLKQTEKLIQCRCPEGFWVAKSDHVLGWASARRFSARPGYNQSLESAVYVDPQECGRGVGTALMKELIRQCKSNNIHHLMARIISGNHASLDFHETFGFQIVGTQNEVGQVNGAWVDVVIMQKLVDSI